MAAIERGYVGLYDIVVRPDGRNRGVSEQVLLHPSNWAKRKGLIQAICR
ncbi:hypothetical protein [Cohnella thermotolerans]|jgi:GNAT superfamily N-acetyltransferase|nr:hypothetical protein [Cohnella thermotolerans]